MPGDLSGTVATFKAGKCQGDAQQDDAENLIDRHDLLIEDAAHCDGQHHAGIGDHAGEAHGAAQIAGGNGDARQNQIQTVAQGKQQTCPVQLQGETVQLPVA